MVRLFRTWALPFIVVMSGGAVFAQQSLSPSRPAPDDLYLDSATHKRSRALAHFAVGVLRQQQPSATSDDYVRHYQKALELIPDSDVLLDVLIRPLLAERKFNAVSDALAPVAAAHPEQTRLVLVLCETLVLQERRDEAIQILERSLKATHWKDPRLVRELAIYYSRSNRFDAVQKLFERALKREHLRRSFVVHQAAALFYYSRANNAEEAAAAEDDRLRAFSHVRRTVDHIDEAERLEDVDSLAQILRDAEKWELLAALLEKARHRPQVSAVSLDLMLAEALFELNRDQDAVKILEEVEYFADLSPSSIFRLGHLYVRADELVSAATAYERLLERVPDNERLRLTLASLYLRMDDPRKAIRVLEGCECEDLRAEKYYYLSHAYRALDQFEKAARMLARVEDEAPPGHALFDTGFFMYYSTLAEKLGYIDRAIKMARKARQKAPDDPDTANFLGYFLADHNRKLNEAEELIHSAVESEPENVAFLDSLAWVYYRQKRYRAALRPILKAIRLSAGSPDPVILDHAGDICLRNGLSLLAYRYWWHALQTGAQDKDAVREKLKKHPIPSS